jgi:hypothetical protein
MKRAEVFYLHKQLKKMTFIDVARRPSAAGMRVDGEFRLRLAGSSRRRMELRASRHV